MRNQRQGDRVKRAVLDATESLFSKTVDVALWSVAYLTVLPFTYSFHEPQWKANVEADNLLSVVSYNRIKQAIINAKRHGFIQKSHRHAWPQITEAGKKRLSSVIPSYDAKRTWDGRLHIITYDIPEKQSEDRHALRDYLRRIGCAWLQDSVWITPYNPIDTLRTFTNEHNLQSTIIISDMGKDGAIGEENISDFIVRVYKLKQLNDRYEEWIKEAQRNGNIDHWMVVSFLSILKDDPQLPFPLLPHWWKGDVAYALVKENLQKVSKFFRSDKK